MQIANKFFVKEGLLKSPFFHIEEKENILIIDKVISFSDVTHLFECVIVGDENTESTTYLCKQVTYDPSMDMINILNIGYGGEVSIGGRLFIKNQIASAYSMGKNKIVITIDSKEEN